MDTKDFGAFSKGIINEYGRRAINMGRFWGASVQDNDFVKEVAQTKGQQYAVKIASAAAEQHDF